MSDLFAQDDKEALLKRFYRRFQVVVGIFITALIVFLLAFPAFSRSHDVPVLLVGSGLGIGSMLYLRACVKRDGIESTELQAYIWRQPMMIVAAVIMAISVIVHLFQVFFPK